MTGGALIRLVGGSGFFFGYGGLDLAQVDGVFAEGDGVDAFEQAV